MTSRYRPQAHDWQRRDTAQRAAFANLSIVGTQRAAPGPAAHEYR